MDTRYARDKRDLEGEREFAGDSEVGRAEDEANESVTGGKDRRR